jgi:hypothetical protein
MKNLLFEIKELADSITRLVDAFADEAQALAFVRAMFDCLSREWPHIDRWRMDKFLMVRVI